MKEFERQAIITALKKMITGSYFSICVIDSCIKIIGCIPPRDIYNALSVLHCVYWNDMTPIFREEVKRNIMVVLSEPSIDLSELDKFYLQGQIEEIKPEKKNWFGLLK
jgi:hypothetical protein